MIEAATQPLPAQRRGSLPPLLRIAERLGTAIEACGLPIARLTEGSLLRAAHRATGVAQFADESFREPLRLILADYQRDANVNLVGRLALRHFCVAALINRLRIQRIVELYPEIRNIPIGAPVVVTGLPRTGTTLMHNLLAQAPGARSFAFWEVLTPAPDPTWVSKPKDPRRKIAATHVRRIRAASRGQSRAIHDVEVDTPEECLHLFQNSFTSEHFLGFSEAPAYREWYEAQPMIEQYRYYRLQLQVLLWQGGGGHLVVKWPFHAYHLKALLSVFPDACVVFTHRDPVKSVASMCSLVSGFRAPTNHVIDPVRLGQWCLGFLGNLGDRAVAARRQLGRQHFSDVSYGELMRDPLGVVRRVYGHFSRPQGPEAEARAGQWLSEHPKDRWGEHKYDLAEYGITPEAARERLAAYTAELEGKP
jgi:hypothetical protein